MVQNSDTILKLLTHFIVYVDLSSTFHRAIDIQKLSFGINSIFAEIHHNYYFFV